jgi:hypothetical protein
MSSFPGSPRLVKGGIVLLDPDTGVLERIIALQYNPDSLTRTLQAQAVTPDGGNRSEALRLKGPAVETLKLEAEIDATDQLASPSQYPGAVSAGIFPQLAVLEMMVSPTAAQLIATNDLSNSGALEIIPVEGPLTLFVWSKNRVVPVRITDFSITEEAFDTALNPIRAKVSLGLRVLSMNDLPFDHKGTGIFLIYQKQKEQLAQLVQSPGFGTLGIGGIP